MKDTLKSVEILEKKINAIVRKSQGDTKFRWRAYLKECRNFIKNEKKILSNKYTILRFAAAEAQKLHELLSNDDKKNREIGKQILISNWEGYLLWIEKKFKDKDYSDKRYMGGSCWTGKYYEAAKLVVFDDKMIKKIALMYKNKYFPKSNITIKIDFKEFRVHYRNSKDKKIAEALKDFLEEFSYDFSNPQVDFFSSGYSSEIYYIS